ncbi:ABC transporter ATP-binding protein [Zavarzinella formosa]|uniref:ABC transporter ATP-binding protein n=1 Tax=Zavarzinella formosa TaxID=360055 RepID=UPI0003085BBA|nr:ATP-binding cassette domain-containing protein [Zavarzinella formosa]
MNLGVDVEVTGLCRRFGGKVILDQLNLSCRAGEFVAIVGRSGSGKSTFLRLLAGLDRPDDGDVRVEGKVLTGLCPSSRMMFQDSRLLPWLRVGDNAGLGLPKSERKRSLELLGQVGLADRVTDWPAILSGGQKQRVALARSLAAAPRLLLLDEPLGSLDALTRLEMQQLIETLVKESGATTILITHDVEEAVALADRVILLAKGRLAHEWEIDLPRPRDRSGQGYVNLTRQILGKVLVE